MSTRTVLGGIGAVVGFIYGGPQGAQIGWMIGSTVGGVVDPEIIKGPSIGDIAAQTAQEGGPRPIVFAMSQPMAGNIIASGEPVIVRKRQSQGKGGPKVETESVYRTYAIGVCEGPILGFARVWRNGQLVYDVLTLGYDDTPFEQITTLLENNAKFLEKARFFLGTFDQLPSPDLEAKFGVGTTPAHRGTVYMVVADEDLTDMRGAIPQYTFQVNTLQGYREVCYGPGVHAWEKGVGLEYIEIDALGAGGGGGSGEGAGSGESAGGGGAGGGGGFSQATIEADDLPDDVTVTVGQGGAGGVTPPELYGMDSERVAGTDGGDTTFGALLTAGGGKAGWVNTGLGGVGTVQNGGQASGESKTQAAGAGGHGGSGGPGTGSLPGGEGGDGSTSFGNSPGGFGGAIQQGTGNDGGDGGNGSAAGLYGGGGGGGGGCAGGGTHPAFDPAFGGDGGDGARGGGGGGGGVAYYGFTGGGENNGNGSPGDGGNGGGGFLCIREFYGENPRMSLADVVTAICLRAGLTAELIDVSQLEDDEVYGFTVTNSYPASAALQALSQVYLFDAANYDGKINFIKRGANSVDTITQAEMVEDDEENIEEDKRADQINIPRVLHLNYFDVRGGLNTDKQSSERAGDRRAIGEASLQSAVIMPATFAARAVAINHKVMVETSTGELRFKLPDNHLDLVPSDPMFVQWEGRTVRVMIQKAEILDGFQQYVCLRDRQSAYTSNVEGFPAGVPSSPPNNVVGPTLLQILDIHILRDADDNLGLSYYGAVSGLLPAWQGAVIEVSIDGGENYIDSTSTRVSSIMGELVTGLADHPQDIPDETNTVRVRIDTPNAELLSSTLAGMMNRANLAIIGDELVNFADVDEVEPGVWDLSYLLRGRKGTDTAAHVAGERFVLLERSFLGIIPASLVDIGRTFTFRATSFGTSPEDGTIVNMTYTGRSQIERAPAYLTARREVDDAIVSWQGVGRLGGGGAVAHGARFAGYRVTFDDGVNPPIVVDTDDTEHTEDVSGLASPITITVQQLNDLTGAGPAAEVSLT